MRSEEELKQFEIKKKANAYFEKQKREINQLRKENKKLEKQKNEYKDILNSIQKVFNIKAISNIKSRLKSIFEAKEGEKQAQEQQVQEQIYRKQKSECVAKKNFSLFLILKIDISHKNSITGF